MTREEANKIVVDIAQNGKYPFSLVDAFVALGMLKLDEPRTMKDRIEALLVGKKLATCSPKTMGAEIGLSDVSTICQVLDAAGLQIIEK